MTILEIFVEYTKHHRRNNLWTLKKWTQNSCYIINTSNILNNFTSLQLQFSFFLSQAFKFNIFIFPQNRTFELKHWPLTFIVIKYNLTNHRRDLLVAICKIKLTVSFTKCQTFPKNLVLFFKARFDFN